MKVAIVILNWNGIGFLQKYLPILCANTPQEDAAVIVADNGSTDGSVAWLKENFSDLQLIEFTENYGFTGGYNRALAQIEAEYFILLNSDIRIPDSTPSFNWLQPLVGFMESNPEVGICQPKMLSEANPRFFEYAGACGGFIDQYGFPFCRGRILSCVEEDNGQYDTPMKIFWASGACMMIRSKIWRELGGLDESFFAHMEEIDLCWRAQLYGYEVWAVPQSHVFHVGGGTLPNNSPRKLYLNYRNNLLMLYKNLPINNSRNALIFKRMCIDGLSGVAYLLQGKFSYYKAVLKGHKDFKKMRNSAPITLLQPNFKNTQQEISGTIYHKSIIVQFFMGRKEFRKLLFENYTKK